MILLRKWRFSRSPHHSGTWNSLVTPSVAQGAELFLGCNALPRLRSCGIAPPESGIACVSQCLNVSRMLLLGCTAVSFCFTHIVSMDAMPYCVCFPVVTFVTL